MHSVYDIKLVIIWISQYQEQNRYNSQTKHSQTTHSQTYTQTTANSQPTKKVTLYLGGHVLPSRRGVPIVAATLDATDGDVDVEGAALALSLGLHPDLPAVQLHNRVADCVMLSMGVQKRVVLSGSSKVSMGEKNKVVQKRSKYSKWIEFKVTAIYDPQSDKKYIFR